MLGGQSTLVIDTGTLADDHVIQKLAIQLPTTVSTFKAGRQSSVCLIDFALINQDYVTAIQSLIRRVEMLEAQVLNQKLLESNLRKLEKDKGDMRFKVGGHTIPAHSAIVSNWSAPLERMLLSMMQEGTSKEIEIKTEDSQIVQTMVHYFYTTELELTQNNAIPLLRLASLYDIGALRDKCCSYLVKHMTFARCLQVYFMAKVYKIEDMNNSSIFPSWEYLEATARKMIEERPVDVLSASPPPFENLAFNEVVQIIIMLSENNISGTSALLSSAFLKWAKTEWNVDDFSQCLACFQDLIDFDSVNHNGEDEFQIFVKGYSKTMSILVTPTMNVAQLKSKIQEKTNFPVELQKLVFNTSILQNQFTMTECSIIRESTIHLAVSAQYFEKPDRENLYKLQNSKKATSATARSVSPEKASEIPGKIEINILRSFCIGSIVRDFKTQSVTPGFNDLPMHILIEILMNDALQTNNKLLILDAISGWVLRKSEKQREAYLSTLLKYVRFPFIPAAQLLAIPSSHPTIASCSAFKPLLQEALITQMEKVNPNKRNASEMSGPVQMRAKKRVSYGEIPQIDPIFFATLVINSIAPK